jgi:hypothetical protein
MIDAPDRETPRFPPDKDPAAAAAIADALSAIGVARGDLAICGGACDGDLLFAEACLGRDMRLEIYIPFDEPTFLANSVDFAGSNWHDRYLAVKSKATLHIMPDELGPLAAGNWRWFSLGGETGSIRPISVNSTDEGWYQELKPIIKLSDVAIMIPGPSLPVLEEFDLLLDQRLHHSVLLFPPRLQNETFYDRIRASARFAEYLPQVPDDGCFLLPYERPDSASLDFAKYPLTSRNLRMILKARSRAGKD